jgi:hypothetical protein
MIQNRSGSSGCGMIADSPRCPGGCCAGSFHASRPSYPSRVVISENVFPPSVLSKSPADSAPTSKRPCAGIRLETFDSFNPPSTSG